MVNYDKATLNHLHDVLLMMLKDFDDFCEENDLTYMTNGGTTIGAILHQGFIPWDDDIDLIMFRDDYEKFVKLFDEKYDKKYELITPQTHENYFFLFSKIMLKDSVFKEESFDSINFDMGIYMDIAVLDRIPNFGLKTKLHILHLRLIQHLIGLKILPISFRNTRLKKILAGIAKLIPISPNKLKNKWKFLAAKYNDCETELWHEFTSLKVFNVAYYEKDIFPVKRTKFESIEVNIPNNAETLLKNYYGVEKLVKWPPSEEQVNHAPIKLDFGKY